jgi:small subunit ribosomal protein S7
MSMNNKTLPFYNVLLGFFIKKGKKQKAKVMLDRTFSILQEKTRKPLSLLMGIYFFRLRTVVEIRKVKKGKHAHYVPFLVGPKRRVFLIVKWLKEAVEEDKRLVSYEEKLSSEILKVLANKPCVSLNKKKENIKLAVSNRSNIYYRW